ncbi:hypothetical protein D3C86_1996840 [compost metagenome]
MQLEQQQQALALGHAQTDGLALRVAHAARHFLGGVQNEGVGAGRAQLEQAVLAVVDLGIGRELGQIAAQQAQMVLVVDLADAADALHGVAVIEMADQRIA